MQNAETVLGVLSERGRRGLPCEQLYRQLFNRELYLLAYGRIYANKGAMTPGVTAETVDAMSMGKIEAIVEQLRGERFRFTPVRRTHIPKKDGKSRPLGLPTWSDKLVGEVVRLLLEAYYEPRFSGCSHGYRPGRGCHTVLRQVVSGWTGTTWFIEGDIADCFGSLDHEVLCAILAEKIHDNRFLRLIRNMLRAGYVEDWTWKPTFSGAPQGGVLSPLLSNIYLDKLDQFVETVLVPEYTRGVKRKYNHAYQVVEAALRRARERGDPDAIRALRKQLRALPSKDSHDPGFRRLRYVRYADDVLLGFLGPKAEAEQIKARLAAFLRDELALELSEAKTLITHARSSAARFLGYHISVQHAPTRLTRGHRATNGIIGLSVPADVIRAKCAPYKTGGEPETREDLVNEHDYVIVGKFGAEYRGVVQYYLLAGNLWKLNKLRWVMVTSMLKTLACKHKSTVTKMADRYKTTIATPHGPRRCFEAKLERGQGKQALVARFGGIPLIRRKTAVIDDHRPAQIYYPAKELIQRLRRGRCELCKHKAEVEVHHVRKLADLSIQPQPAWAQIMANMRRKSVIVCQACHDLIHDRQTTACTK